jgi:hypothetical protein
MMDWDYETVKQVAKNGLKDLVVDDDQMLGIKALARAIGVQRNDLALARKWIRQSVRQTDDTPALEELVV